MKIYASPSVNKPKLKEVNNTRNVLNLSSPLTYKDKKKICSGLSPGSLIMY